MEQIGIIYKFTIIAKYKFDGHKPFYIGQHLGLNNFHSYLGSGRIWYDFIKRIKKDYPKHWRKFIKREILFQKPCSQKVLDIMEKYYIKKEKSHYSYKLGGCNVLWGTANKFGSGNPAKEPLVRKKIRELWQQESFRIKQRKNYLQVIRSKDFKDNFSKVMSSEEHKKKLSASLKKSWENSEEKRKKLSENMKKRYEDDDWCKKISLSLKKSWENSEGRREKLSENMKNIWKDEEYKKKLSEKHKGRKHTEETKLILSKKMSGRKFSEEHKRKLSEAAKHRYSISKMRKN